MRSILIGTHLCSVNAVLTPKTSISFDILGMLSSDGHCKVFDEKANGYDGIVCHSLNELDTSEAKAVELYC